MTLHPPRAEIEEAVHTAAHRSLREAIARARAEVAERETAFVDLRAAAIARLETLRERLKPLYAQIPREVEFFDLGLVGAGRPRLFVDVIAFVELARDQTTFRFQQDTRAGRVLLAESEDPAAIERAVTDYVARRLVERERALAADAAMERASAGRAAAGALAAPADHAPRPLMAAPPGQPPDAAPPHDGARTAAPGTTPPEAFPRGAKPAPGAMAAVQATAPAAPAAFPPAHAVPSAGGGLGVALAAAQPTASVASPQPAVRRSASWPGVLAGFLLALVFIPLVAVLARPYWPQVESWWRELVSTVPSAVTDRTSTSTETPPAAR